MAPVSEENVSCCCTPPCLLGSEAFCSSYIAVSESAYREQVDDTTRPQARASMQANDAPQAYSTITPGHAPRPQYHTPMPFAQQQPWQNNTGGMVPMTPPTQWAMPSRGGGFQTPGPTMEQIMEIHRDTQQAQEVMNLERQAMTREREAMTRERNEMTQERQRIHALEVRRVDQDDRRLDLEERRIQLDQEALRRTRSSPDLSFTAASPAAPAVDQRRSQLRGERYRRMSTSAPDLSVAAVREREAAIGQWVRIRGHENAGRFKVVDYHAGNYELEPDPNDVEAVDYYAKQKNPFRKKKSSLVLDEDQTP